MKTEFETAFLLHRFNYRETSLLLDVFTREYGRLNLVAKGVRTKKSKKSALLQPFQKLRISWSGKSELMNLVDVESCGKNTVLSGESVLSGFYINELLVRLLHKHEAHPDLFDIYQDTLVLLNDTGDKAQYAMRMFEIRLLESLGYGLILDHVAETGEKIDDQSKYYYQPDRGPLTSVPADNNYLLVSGKVLKGLSTKKLPNAQLLRESRKFMRFILDMHIGTKPLSSRNLYRAYLKNKNPGTVVKHDE